MSRTRTAARRLVGVTTAAGLVAAGVGLGPSPVWAASTLHVCAAGCTYADLAPAVAAARNGDTISLASGTYHGGVTVERSIRIEGAGASTTHIVGGGPVISIGVAGAGHQPAVSISGVSINDGLTRSSLGRANMALGGGIFVAPSTHYRVGGSLTLTDVTVTGNRVEPSGVDNSFGIPCAAGRECPFAWAAGGGIDSWGLLTLDRVTVSHNQASGPLTSDADGGGIFVHEGRLDMTDSFVTANRAEANWPNGRFAEGGGLMVDTSAAPQPASVSITHTTISHDTASLSNDLPSFSGTGELIELSVSGGGVQVGDGVDVTVDDTVMSDNTATAADSHGEPGAYNGGMAVGDGQLTMSGSVVTRNQTSVTTATDADSGPSGGALEVDGPATITGSRITDNVATASSSQGDAGLTGAFTVNNFNGDPRLVTLQGSIVSGNATLVTSNGGIATAMGGGVFNSSLLLVRDSDIAGNSARAEGSSGNAQGGGIWNGDFGPVHASLTLEDTVVTRNEASGGPHILVQGGGLFTTAALVSNDATITDNQPDQCWGC